MMINQITLKPDYISPSLTELIFKSKGRKRKLRLIVYALNLMKKTKNEKQN